MHSKLATAEPQSHPNRKWKSLRLSPQIRVEWVVDSNGPPHPRLYRGHEIISSDTEICDILAILREDASVLGNVEFQKNCAWMWWFMGSEGEFPDYKECDGPGGDNGHNNEEDINGISSSYSANETTDNDADDDECGDGSGTIANKHKSDCSFQQQPALTRPSPHDDSDRKNVGVDSASRNPRRLETSMTTALVEFDRELAAYREKADAKLMGELRTRVESLTEKVGELQLSKASLELSNHELKQNQRQEPPEHEIVHQHAGPEAPTEQAQNGLRPLGLNEAHQQSEATELRKMVRSLEELNATLQSAHNHLQDQHHQVLFDNARLSNVVDAFREAFTWMRERKEALEFQTDRMRESIEELVNDSIERQTQRYWQSSTHPPDQHHQALFDNARLLSEVNLLEKKMDALLEASTWMRERIEALEFQTDRMRESTEELVNDSIERQTQERARQQQIEEQRVEQQQQQQQWRRIMDVLQAELARQRENVAPQPHLAPERLRRPGVSQGKNRQRPQMKRCKLSQLRPPESESESAQNDSTSLNLLAQLLPFLLLLLGETKSYDLLRRFVMRGSVTDKYDYDEATGLDSLRQLLDVLAELILYSRNHRGESNDDHSNGNSSGRGCGE